MVDITLGPLGRRLDYGSSPDGPFEDGRWIKFEEKVEQGGERWSKPHVATLSLHSLFELRTCMEKGSILLDMEASSLPQVVEMIVDNQIETGLLKQDMKEKVTYTLLRKHRHQTKKSNLRSLADIGKTVSSASRMFTNPDNGNAEASGLWPSFRDPPQKDTTNPPTIISWQRI
ncbi:UNVERIFIED_CONTAM: Electrogenic sodium bicarbonate cotransporter 1 [Gekko kuhli]